MLIDSHCHLDFPELAADLDGVVERARTAGVGGMVTISTELEKAAGLCEIARRYDNVWCSVGIHPHESGRYPGVRAEEIAALAEPEEVVAIGESGLDYYYEHSPREAQQHSFRAHIDVARRTGLPLVVHTRGADEDTVAILAEEMEAGAFTGLIHCFSTSQWLAEQAIALGLYVSIAGIVTFNKAGALREAVAALPLERLLVETDSPFLAPVPNRGKSNEPAWVVQTARKVAELKGVDMAEVAAATTANFFALFTRCRRPAEP